MFPNLISPLIYLHARFLRFPSPLLYRPVRPKFYSRPGPTEPEISHFLGADTPCLTKESLDARREFGREMLRSLVRHSRAIRAVRSGDAPSDLIRARIFDRERARRRPRDPARDEFFVPTPESASWLDTASLPMVLTAVAVALFAKLLMMVLLFFFYLLFANQIGV